MSTSVTAHIFFSVSLLLLYKILCIIDVVILQGYDVFWILSFVMKNIQAPCRVFHVHYITWHTCNWAAQAPEVNLVSYFHEIQM